MEMNKTVLLVEDNMEMRENTAEILELAGYSVATAVNGKDGVKLAKSMIPDLIICDIMMPELDGYGVLHMLSKDTKKASIPFVFLSAKAEKMDFRKGMSLGADDYLTKPFDDMELLNVVETRLKKSEIIRSEFGRTAEGVNEFILRAGGMDELLKISKERLPRKYGKKELVHREGSFPIEIYFLVSGKVKTYRTNEDGKELVTGLYKEGDFFGYTPVLENKAYEDSAMSIDDSEVMAIPKDVFFFLLFNNRDVASKFIKILSDSVVEKEERLVQLAYNSVRKRLADSLLLYRKQYMKSEDEIFSMAIPREELASMVGTATETVIRALSDFKEEKLVDIKNSTISILNPEKLRRIKN
jgi:CRP-like cAMP-binding protein/ActR/RegA family two-component response regulator